MICQLEHLAEAGETFGRRDKIRIQYPRALRALVRNTTRGASRRLRVLRDWALQPLQPARAVTEPTATKRPPPRPLGLQPGERVRVRSPEAIRATLDDQMRCRGLSYMPVVMDRFCGREFVVKKRIDLFFDERQWRMLKLRDVVILEGVHCEPPRTAEPMWAGCTRTCFSFWKEDWLERVEPREASQQGGQP